MRIDISVHISDARQWLIALRQALESDGHTVFFRIFGAERGRDPATSTLKLIELTAFGSGKGLWPRGNLNHISPQAPDANADLLITLSPGGASEARAITLFLDGVEGIGSAMPELLKRRVPFIELRGSDGAVLASGLPAVESPDIIVQALDDFYTRAITMLRMGVRNAFARRAGAGMTFSPAQYRHEQHNFGFASLGQRLLNRVLGRHRIADHWRVGLRRRGSALSVDGDTIIEGFDWLPDDGQRYYADPILFEEGGRDFVFVEEFPYATRKGLISVVELDEAGRPLHPPRPIIERAGHLSYPHLFRHGGEIWMMPENSSEKRLPLYRARQFPHDWVHEGDLVTGVGLHDATLLEQAGRFILLANTDDDGGSSWDCLSLFAAPSPVEPFTRLGEGPLLVDARYARSAGPVIAHRGQFIRPVQSCLGHYGRFLRFLAIESLGPDGITQREIGRLLAPMGAQAAGVHTYSQSTRFEAIDAFGI